MSTPEQPDPSSIFYEFDIQEYNAHKKAEVAAAIRAVERKSQLEKLSKSLKKSRTNQDELTTFVSGSSIDSFLPSWLSGLCFDYYRHPFPCREQIEGLSPATYRRYQVLLQIESKTGEPAPYMQCYQVTFYAEMSVSGAGLRRRSIICGTADAPYNKHNELYSARWNRTIHPHPADIGDGVSDLVPYRNPARESIRVPHKLNTFSTPPRVFLGGWIGNSCDDFANFREWDFYCSSGI